MVLRTVKSILFFFSELLKESHELNARRRATSAASRSASHRLILVAAADKVGINRLLVVVLGLLVLWLLVLGLLVLGLLVFATRCTDSASPSSGGRSRGWCREE